MDIVISYLNFNSKHLDKCKVVVKFISLLNTSNLSSLGVVQYNKIANYVYCGKTPVTIFKFFTLASNVSVMPLSFPGKVGSVGICWHVLLKFENKFKKIISHFNFNSKHHDKCKLALKLLTTFNYFQFCFHYKLYKNYRHCQFCMPWENSKSMNRY